MLYLVQIKHVVVNAVVGSQACVYDGVKGDFTGDDLSVRAGSEYVRVCSDDSSPMSIACGCLLATIELYRQSAFARVSDVDLDTSSWQTYHGCHA